MFKTILKPLAFVLVAFFLVACPSKSSSPSQITTDTTATAGATSVFHAKLNVIVICSSCTIDSEPSTGHTILLDQDTGDIWAYRNFNAAPTYLGRFEKMGEPAKRR